MNEPTRAEAEAEEVKLIPYEFSLTCGCIQLVAVNATTYEPVGGRYRCPDCEAEEWPP